MSPLQITAVLIRIFAIWCALDSLTWFLSFWDPNQSDTYGRFLSVSYTVLYAAVAVVLWAFPSLIARKMLVPSESPSSPTVAPRLLLNIAVVATGRYTPEIRQRLLNAATSYLSVEQLDEYVRELERRAAQEQKTNETLARYPPAEHIRGLVAR